LAALGGRRDRRQEGRALPVHDDPELVDERLQPGHQAGRRLRGCDDGVGRRKPRLEADDEVPGDLAARRAGAWRGALDRIREQGPAPGRGREGRPRRAEHDVRDHLEVDLEERRPRRLPRSAGGGEGREGLEVEGRLRRADPRRGLALGHLPVHEDRRGRGRHRPRGDRLEDRRGAALLPDVARPHGGRGERDDRLRLRRADHEGASTGVRGRDEPPHSAPDGRLRRLAPDSRCEPGAFPTRTAPFGVRPRTRPKEAAVRAELLERYRTLPFPTTTDEPWRFTDLKGFDPDAFVSNGKVRGQTPAGAGASMLELDVAGFATASEDGIEIERGPEGVTFEPLRDHELLGTLVGADEKFAAHNAALWEHGLLVHVSRGLVLEKPLYVRVANTHDGGALFWRLLVVAEPESRFSVVEEFVSQSPELSGYSNAVSELFVGDGAKVEYVSL